jgi:CRP-like cAMP-binding protein
MSEQIAEPVRLSPSELRTLFLFEKLDDDQLSWLSQHGYCRTCAAGEMVHTEGEPATCFFVLLSGTLSLHRRVENTEVETARTNQRGVYTGATQSFVKGMAELPYWGSTRAVTDCDLWVIDASEFGEKFREWFPMAVHLLEGLSQGYRSSQVLIGRSYSRAEQPSDCRRTRHRVVAGTGQQDAAQAGTPGHLRRGSQGAGGAH